MNSATSLFLQMVFIVLSAIGVYSFVSAAREGEQRRVCSSVCSLSPDYAARNRSAPDFELSDLHGKKVRLSDYRGKVVILNFWTKTCAPCLEEMPSLGDLAKILNKYPNIELVTVTTDESAEDAKATLRSVLGEDAPFTTLVDAKDEVVRNHFGTRLFPETWFIDPQGVIRARIDGPRNWQSLAPLTIDFSKSIAGPASCDVEFERRAPKGPECNDFPVAG
jgi:peroxiredoxin